MDTYALFYGVMVMVVLAVSWISDGHVCQKLALILLAAWASSNVVVNAMGFAKAPLIVPSIDAFLAIVVAIVGYWNKSRTALIVFLLYVVVGLVHVWAFVTRTQATYTYYATTNILFMLQLISVGSSGAWLAIRHRAAAGGQRDGPDRPRRHGMA